MSSTSYAHVYDTLYSDPAFLEAQMAFLAEVFGPPPSTLLDLGCGTGTHLARLAWAGFQMVGVDADALMLRSARHKTQDAILAQADLRRLPFSSTRARFDGALCLESPLAHLLDAASLATALSSIRNALCDGAKIVVDIYDYLGALGARPVRGQEVAFEADTMRVRVRESHRYNKESHVWSMRQHFVVEDANGRSEFEIVHRLRMRTIDEYAEALQSAGFTVLEAMTAYPGSPKTLRHERRMILVARR